MIIEYMLVREMDVKRTPSWIEDGGYFFDREFNTYVGYSPDLANRDYYVPDTVVTLTRAELKTKLLTMHNRYAPSSGKYLFTDEDNNPLNNTQVEAMADTWCDERGES